MTYIALTYHIDVEVCCRILVDVSSFADVAYVNS